MRRTLAALAWMAMCGTGAVRAQTGYQHEVIAPDPSLKAPYTQESMLMRASYESKHQDCLDAGFHLNAVIDKKPRWAEAEALRLICERAENRRVEERDTLLKLLALQPGNWRWWSDSAHLNAQDAEFAEAINDITIAIRMRPWDPELYDDRSRWEEALHRYKEAYADAERVHRLMPESGAPLEWMAQHAVATGRSEAEAQRLHALAELNPELLPMKTRADEDLPISHMTGEELLLRAGYAERVKKYDLALRFVKAALATNSNWEQALWMHYELLTRGTGLREASMQEVQQALRLAEQIVANSRGRQVPRIQIPASPRLSQEARSQAEMIALDLERLIRLNPIRADYLRIRIEWEPTQEAILDCGQVIAIEPYVAANYAARAANEDALGGELPHVLAPGRRSPGPPAMAGGPLPTAPARGIPYTPLPTNAPPPPMDASEAIWPTDIGDSLYRTQAIADYVRAIDLAPGEPGYYAGLAREYDIAHAFTLEIAALNMALIGDPDDPGLKSARARFP